MGKECLILQGNTFNEQERIARQLEAVEARYEELSIRITLPEVIADTAAFTKLMREHSDLAELNALAVEYRRLLNEIDGAREMLSDPDMADMAEEELKALEEQLTEKTREARIALLPKDPDDYKNAVLEVRAGAGGDEASLFAAMLMRMYLRYAERHGLTAAVLSVNDTEIGGVKEAVLSVTGRGAFSRLKYESGVHRIQRVPVTEANGKKQTSTATVAVLPEMEDVEVDIKPDDLRIDTYRASGHGGQYINRTDSAVRITHLPTGLVVTCQDEKSQLKNREQAMKVLKSRLYDLYRTKADSEYASNRRAQVGTGERNERIRTYNFNEGRVTDHRIGLTLYRVDAIVDGDLDEIIDALTLDEQARKLRELR